MTLMVTNIRPLFHHAPPDLVMKIENIIKEELEEEGFEAHDFTIMSDGAVGWAL